MVEQPSYHRSILEAHEASTPGVLPSHIQAKIDAANWPEGLVERALEIRVNLIDIEAWVDHGWPTVEMIDEWLDQQRSIHFSTLTAREATWADIEILVDLCAASPEKVGDWQVTVERGPNPLAQYRLQEYSSVLILEDLKVGLGMTASSTRNALIGGQRTTARWMGGWRIRDGFRGLGLSKYLQNSPGPGLSRFGLVTYWYVRSGNASAAWIDKVRDDMADRPGDFAMPTDELSATVSHFRNADLGHFSSRVRAATEEDLPRCFELINRSNEGLDLFRPYDLHRMEERLNDAMWGPTPEFIPDVYGWNDFRVLEIDETVVACGGLWDRGRDVREVWRQVSASGDGAEHVLDPTAVLDFGFAEGHASAAAELLSHFLAATGELGRSGMMAALEFLPDVAAAVADLAPQSENRTLHVMPFSMPGLENDAEITRPHTDLAYW